METIFELLEKNKLVDDEHIERIIMRQWSIGHIIDFKDSLAESVEASVQPQKDLDLTTYAFVANSDMSAQHYACCFGWDCRIRKTDNLARFATLYSDCVYIQNYFADYRHKPTNWNEELDFRYFFAGDLKILARLGPLMTAGVVQFIQPPEPGFHMCPRCAEKLIPTFKEVNSALEKEINVLSEKYVEQTSATLFLDPEFRDVPSYRIHIQGPEELWEHGAQNFFPYLLPPSLSPKTRRTSNVILAKGIKLSKSDIAKADIVRRAALDPIARDIWTQHFLSRVSGMNLKYLTNRDIDISFLEAVTKDEDFRKYSGILRSHLIYELPILEGISLNSLLDIRQKERDAFLLYRDGINEVVKTYISQRRDLSELDAREIYVDIVQPKLNKLNARVKSIKRSLWRKPIYSISITAGILTVGLCSNILTPELGAVVGALGGFQSLKNLVESIVEATQTPEEIRNDNFYFLWKLSKK
jgi:hypothetical protein